MNNEFPLRITRIEFNGTVLWPDDFKSGGNGRVSGLDGTQIVRADISEGGWLIIEGTNGYAALIPPHKVEHIVGHFRAAPRPPTDKEQFDKQLELFDNDTH